MLNVPPSAEKWTFEVQFFYARTARKILLLFSLIEVAQRKDYPHVCLSTVLLCATLARGGRGRKRMGGKGGEAKGLLLVVAAPPRSVRAYKGERRKGESNCFFVASLRKDSRDPLQRQGPDHSFLVRAKTSPA